MTSQLIHWDSGTTLSWNYGTDDRAIWHKQLNATFYTNTMFGTEKDTSTRGNTCAQVHVLDKMFVALHPMHTQSEYLSSLNQFAKEVGVPKKLICVPSFPEGL